MANEELAVTWAEVAVDIGGQPAQVQGYRIYDMTDPAAPFLAAEVRAPASSHTLVGYVEDANNPPPIAVAAYNSVGEGARSQTVVASAPSLSVPSQVTGVTVTIIPK